MKDLWEKIVDFINGILFPEPELVPIPVEANGRNETRLNISFKFTDMLQNSNFELYLAEEAFYD